MKNLEVGPVELRRIHAVVTGMRSLDCPDKYEPSHEGAMVKAVEQATRVEVTDAVIIATERVHYAGGFYSRKGLIEAALAELGFEVVKR